MSISIVKKMVVLESCTGIAIEPNYTGISPEAVEEYMIDHPFPNDHEWYDKDSMLQDIQSTGTWTLPLDLSDETVNWIEDMLQELW